MNLSPEDIIKILNLTPHPTCGLVKQTYLSEIILPKNILPSKFNSDRSVGSVLYFLLTEKEQIKLHKINSDQMYHFYFGCPIEVFLLYPDGTAEIKLMGDDLKNNMIPQLLIPAGTFHATKMHSVGAYSLLGTSEWIGVDPKDIEIGDINKLIELYPACCELKDIRKLWF